MGRDQGNCSLCTEPAPHPTKNDPAPNVKSAKLEKPRMKAVSPKSVVTSRPLWWWEGRCRETGVSPEYVPSGKTLQVILIPEASLHPRAVSFKSGPFGQDTWCLYLIPTCSLTLPSPRMTEDSLIPRCIHQLHQNLFASRQLIPAK